MATKVIARSYFDVVGLGDVGIDFPDPSLAVQASKDECDINYIVKKYMRTGELPGVRQGIYADLSEMTDLRDAIHMVNDAQQAFMDLPAEVRRYFDNDPTKLVEFAANPDNGAKAVELGLAIPRPLQEPSTSPKAGSSPAVAPSGQSTPKGSELPST